MRVSHFASLNELRARVFSGLMLFLGGNLLQLH